MSSLINLSVDGGRYVRASALTCGFGCPLPHANVHTPDLMLSRTTESVEVSSATKSQVQPSLNCNQVNLVRRNPSYEASSLNGLNQESLSYERTKTLPWPTCCDAKRQRRHQ